MGESVLDEFSARSERDGEYPARQKKKHWQVQQPFKKMTEHGQVLVLRAALHRMSNM